MSHGFHIDNGVLYCDKIPLSDIGEKFETPLYVYSAHLLKERCQRILQAFAKHPTLVCYATKANSNLSILRLVKEQGLGADIVSHGEMEKCLHADFTPDRLVFSGVGKTASEIAKGLSAQILAFNVESLSELKLIEELASRHSSRAMISLRVNPNIPVKTHSYIATGIYDTKFGVPESQLKECVELINKSKTLALVGLSCHLGSQIATPKVYGDAAKRLVALADGISKKGKRLEFINLGGGYPISYNDKAVPEIETYADVILRVLKKTKYRLIIEPGRWIAGPAGVLVTQVIRVKQNKRKNFVVVDASMTDLIRPALYEAFHKVEPAVIGTRVRMKADIVGPVCETGDFLALGRDIPKTAAGDFLVIRDTGAYGASMSSNYNLRPRAAEVLVEGSKTTLVRRREKLESLWAEES